MNDRAVVMRVVTLLGACALIFGAGLVWLVHSALAKTQVDASAVALVGTLGTITGSAVTGLAALLVNTRTTPNDAEVKQALDGLVTPDRPLPVEVKTPGGPVPVDPTPDQGDDGEEPGPAPLGVPLRVDATRTRRR